MHSAKNAKHIANEDMKLLNGIILKRMKAFIMSIFLSITLFAYDFEADGIFYNILSDEDYTLAVTGGERNDNIPYNFYYSGIVNIPETVPFHGHEYKVVSIDDGAFVTCINVSYIVLPSTLQHIGKRAFSYCQGLSSITLPEGVISIGDEAFTACDKLESLVLPKSLAEIGVRPFALSNKLNVTIADDHPFFIINQGVLYNTSTKEVVLSLPQTDGDLVLQDDVKSIRSYAFSDSKVRSVTVNEGITRIEDYTFAYSEIQRVTLPTTVVSIGNNSFYSCAYLYDIYIQGPVKTIGNNAFQYCENLPLIDLPSSVEIIGNNAFMECKRLKKITLPKNLTVIGQQAFKNCVALENIAFPKALTRIEPEAFAGCRLTNIVIDENITDIGDNAFNLSWETPMNISITIKGNNIKHIGKYAFYTEHDKSVKIYADTPPSVEEMAFGNYWGDLNEHEEVYSMTVHVKKGLKNTYKGTNGWELYTIIDDLEGEASALIDKAIYSLRKGDVEQASVTIKPDAVTNVSIKWRSDNTDIVFIDENKGQFIGLQVGETIIHADITAVYAGEQITLSASASVEVTEPNAIQGIYSSNGSKYSIFNIDGTRANHINKGIKILKTSDGHTKKVLVAPK